MSKQIFLPNTHHTHLDSLNRYAEILGFGDIHTKIDHKTGLRSIIAIHNVKLGPAIGGCRLLHYETTDYAYADVLRLAHMMTFKAAISNLPHGGAKAVIIKPKKMIDRTTLFEKFGDFVNELNGRYITAIDSGTSSDDMDIIAKRTPYVTCTTQSGAGGDPSPYTALGVRRGIEAACQFKLGVDSLDGIHVAIQGAGHVGYHLAKELSQLGAKITMTDINPMTLEHCIKELNVTPVAPDAIYDVEADVFSPCALGAILNLPTIKRLKVKIIAGSANNQLAHQHYGHLLHEKGILFAPDFLINSGGLIHVTGMYDHGDYQKSLEQIDHIYHTALEIFSLAKVENSSTNLIAEKLALKRLS